MLEEKSIIDSITWRPETGTMEVRRADVIYKDGVEISRRYHRHVVEARFEDLSQEDESVRKIAELFVEERKEAAARVQLPRQPH
jgi:hypothetical protein